MFKILLFTDTDLCTGYERSTNVQHFELNRLHTFGVLLMVESAVEPVCWKRVGMEQFGYPSNLQPQH